MAETEQSPPQSTTSAVKSTNASFSIWPPTERTRDAVRDRLIETLSTPSILSKRYGTVSREEATDAAKLIEEEAFESAGKTASTDDKGFDILQVYSKEISKRMLHTMKARSGEAAVPTVLSVNDSAEKVEAESPAPPQNEKMDSVADDDWEKLLALSVFLFWLGISSLKSVSIGYSVLKSTWFFYVDHLC